MNKSKKYLIFDLGVVRGKGFDYFLNSQPWPVDDSIYHEFVNSVNEFYTNLVYEQTSEELFDIALVEMAFVSNIMHISHYNFAKNFCIDHDISLKSSSYSNSSMSPNWTDIGNFYSNAEFPYGKFARMSRRVAKNYIFNRHRPVIDFFKWIFSRSNTIGIGSHETIKKQFIHDKDVFCDHLDWPDLVNKAVFAFNKTNKNKADKFILNAEKEIVYPFIEFLKKCDPNFTKSIDFDLVVSAWRKRFRDIYAVYSGIKLLKIPKKLLVTEVGKPFHKIISRSLSRSKCKVLNFSHGNDSALINQRWMGQVLISHCNYYVLETETMRNRFESAGKKRKIEERIQTNYITINSDYYSVLRKKYSEYSNESNNIMIMGYPMNTYRNYDESLMFFHYKVSLEYYIMKLLSKYNMSVVYKAHPDRLLEIYGIADSYSDKILTEPFESVWKEAGVLIFTYVSTTTFCYAVNLPIPIVLVEHNETSWNKGMRDLISCRVEIVQADIVDGVVIMDDDVLINAIEKSKLKVDMQVAKQITG